MQPGGTCANKAASHAGPFGDSTIAMAHGFRPAEGFRSEGLLQKIAVGRPIHESNWGWLGSQLQSLAGVGLPKSMPADALERLFTVTSPKGGSVRMRLNDLETLLSPVLFASNQRIGAAVPIRKEFADLLLESRQFRMLESPEVTFLQERTYFSDPRTASIIQEGGCLCSTSGAKAAVSLPWLLSLGWFGSRSSQKTRCPPRASGGACSTLGA